MDNRLREFYNRLIAIADFTAYENGIYLEHPIVYDFDDLMYSLGIVNYEFDWRSFDSEKIIDIGTLSLEEVKNYITYIVRADRFSGNNILYYMNNGVIQKLIKRLLKIYKE